MKNDNDIKKPKLNLCEDNCFILGYFGSCFLSTYAIQLWLVLWDGAPRLFEYALFGVNKEYAVLPGIFVSHRSELSVFDFLPIVPFIVTIIAFIPGSMMWGSGFHNRFGNLGAFAVGVAWWLFIISVFLSATHGFP